VLKANRMKRVSFDRCLRIYVILVCTWLLVALACAAMWYFHFVQTPMQGGWNGGRVMEFLLNFSPPFLMAVLLLLPWWHRGRFLFAIGFSLFLIMGGLVLWAAIKTSIQPNGPSPLSYWLILSAWVAQIVYFTRPSRRELSPA